MNNFHLKDKAFEQLLKSKFKTFENEFQATCEMQYNDAGSIIVMPVCELPRCLMLNALASW